MSNSIPTIDYNDTIYTIDFNALAEISAKFVDDEEGKTIVTEINETKEFVDVQGEFKFITTKEEIKKQLVINEVKNKANLVLSNCLDIVFNEGLGLNVGEESDVIQNEPNEYSLSFKIAFNTLLFNKIIIPLT